MSEEIKVTQETEQHTPEAKQTQSRRSRILQRTYLFSAIFLVLAISNDFLEFGNFGAWQILGDATALLIALVILAVSYLRFRRGEEEKASFLIPFTILMAYAPGDLFLEGVTVFNLISGILLHVIAYYIFKPRNTLHWLRQTVIFIFSVLVFSSINLFKPFDIANSQSWQTSLPLLTAGITLLLAWQILQNIRIRTIQTRLLVILIAIGLGPILISSIASVFIDLSRDTRLAESNIQTISDLKIIQIQNWIDTLETDLTTLERDSKFVRNAEFLALFTPTEDFRQQISEEIIGSFQNLILATQRFRSLSLVSTDGDVLISSNPSYQGLSLIGQGSFDPGLDTTYFSTPQIETLNVEGIVHMYFPLQNEEGDDLGLIHAEVQLEFLAATAAEAAQLVGEGGEAYIISAENQLITQVLNAPEIQIGFNAIDSSEFYAGGGEIQAFESQALQYENIQDEPVIGSYTWIPEIKSILVVEQSRAEAFQSLRLNLLINLSIAVITLIATITLAIVIARNFAAPIKDLSDAARRVWQGEITRIDPINRQDEIGELSTTLSEMTSRLTETTTNLEQTVAERTAVLERRSRYLETASTISRAVTNIYELNALLNTIAQLISENFGFYHIGIFINDERNEFAVLRAANSEGGWKMLAREHKLKVGAEGIVGYVTDTGQPRIQQQVVGEDSVYFDNPDLPETRSEMALPLQVGTNLFGALDVQSTEEQAFSEEDVSVLQGLADSVAVAIQNTRLISQLQESLEAERRLFGELTKETWQAMLSRRNQAFSIRSDAAGTQLVTSPSTEIGQRAFKENSTVVGERDEEDNAYPLAIPVTVRGGVTIGVVETQKPAADGPWTKEEISILENVSSEMGLALDNARLFEETQRRSQRDRIAADLSTKIWSSSDIENILQTAVKELGSALQVSQGAIRLSLPEDETLDNIGDGANQS